MFFCIGVTVGQLRQCAGRSRPVHGSRLLESRGHWRTATFYPSSPSQLAHDVIARFPGRRSDPGAFAGQAVPRGVRDVAAALSGPGFSPYIQYVTGSGIGRRHHAGHLPARLARPAGLRRAVAAFDLDLCDLQERLPVRAAQAPAAGLARQRRGRAVRRGPRPGHRRTRTTPRPSASASCSTSCRNAIARPSFCSTWRTNPMSRPRTSLGLPLGTVKALLHRARKRLIELTSEAA